MAAEYVESMIARALAVDDREAVIATAQHRDVAWRAIVVSIPDLPAWVLEAMAEDPNTHMRVAVAAHPGATETVHGRLIEGAQRRPDGDTKVLCAMTSPTAEPTPGTLVRLAEYRAAVVRRAAAAHIATPPESLERLAGEVFATIRAAVAANPATPVDVVEALSADTGTNAQTVRAAAAANPRLSAESLERLAFAGDSDSVTLRVVAANPSTPPRALANIAAALNGGTTGPLGF